MSHKLVFDHTAAGNQPGSHIPKHSPQLDEQVPDLPLDQKTVLNLQHSIGNRATQSLIARSRQQGHPTVRTLDARPAPIQLVREDEFKANPEGFINENLLSLDMEKGLNLRATNPGLKSKYGQFIKEMGKVSKHWFKLMPDPDRTTEEQSTYIVTPAIEKYVGEYRETNEFIGSLHGLEGVPVVGDEGTYIQSLYVPYFTKKPTDPETQVGHTTVKKERTEEGFNPDFVFTAAMNGCAFAVTPREDDEESFEAWHFQSPGSHSTESSQFRQDYAPTDWFGAEEYDEGGHRGLYETTNFLWRGGEGTWKVLSQVTEVDSHNINKVEMGKVQSRELNLDEEEEDSTLEYTKKIFAGFAKDQHDEVERNYGVAANNNVKKTHKDVENLIHKLFQKVLFVMDGEVGAINGAVSMDALHTVAGQLKAARAGAVAEVTGYDTQLGVLLTGIDTRERSKYGWRQDKTLLSDIGLLQAKLDNVRREWGQTAWMDQLSAETATED